MRAALSAQLDLPAVLGSPIVAGLAVAALGLAMVLSSRDPRIRWLGRLTAAAGLVTLAVVMPKLSPLTEWSQWAEQIVFWLLAGTALACSAAAITAHNPVYSAIWFAGSLLGIAGLFLFQHAQFLGVATLVVYAGAIVVTFLFVLMLAQPEGQSRYDRISWSRSVAPVAVLAGLALVILVVQSFSAPPLPAREGMVVDDDSDHMIRLGTELFSRHLVSVEIAGTLLLVALVGAVAIMIQGKSHRGSARSPQERNPQERNPQERNPQEGNSLEGNSLGGIRP